jgi:hypothetical protein
VDARSILGVPAVRPALLDHLPFAGAAEAQARGSTDHDMTPSTAPEPLTPPAWCENDDDELDDDFDDDEDDDADDDEEDDDDDNAEDPETWQVRERICGENRQGFA